jgi:hypothetical protein
MKNIEDHLHEIFASSKSEGEIRIKMDNLTSIIELAQQSGTGADHYAAT